MTWFHTSNYSLDELGNSPVFDEIIFLSNSSYFMSQKTKFVFEVNNDDLNIIEHNFLLLEEIENTGAYKKWSELCNELEIDAGDAIGIDFHFFIIIDDTEVAGEMSWEAQKIIGQIASELGYDAVLSGDEQGSLLIADSNKIKKFMEIKEIEMNEKKKAGPVFPAIKRTIKQLESMTKKELETYPKVWHTSLCGPCISFYRAVKKNKKTWTLINWNGGSIYTQNVDIWSVHFEPCRRCLCHPKTDYPDGYLD